MTGKKSYGKYKKRSNKKYKRYRTIKNVVPDSHVVKLRYVDNISLDAGGGLSANYLYRANSAFDPDYTGTGHQPLGYDQWVPFYDHYTVVGAKCTAIFTPTDILPTTAVQMVGVLLQDGITTIPNPTLIQENTGSAYKLLNGGNAVGMATVRKGFSAKKFFGLKDVRDNRGVIGSATNGNPTEGAYFNIYQSALGSTQNPGLIRVNVTIEYVVLFTERKILPQS